MVKRHTHNVDVDRQNGLVKDRFVLDDADQKRWPNQWATAPKASEEPQRWVDVTTAIGPRGNTTVLTINGTRV